MQSWIFPNSTPITASFPICLASPAMTHLTLKSHQQAALDALGAFARAAPMKRPALATSRGRFFPDFVAGLMDGRVAVLKFKSAQLDRALASP